MPRPRKVSDEQVLAAAGRVIAREGVLRATLEAIGVEVGVTAAALVQRFGSRRGLLLALTHSGVRDVEARFAAARGGASPLAALRAALAHEAGGLSSRETLARSLSFLQVDLSDDEFHQVAREWFAALREGVRALLEDAQAAGELDSCDVRALARAVEVAYHGSLISWTMRAEGEDCAQALRRDVDAVLTPYLRTDAPLA